MNRKKAIIVSIVILLLALGFYTNMDIKRNKKNNNNLEKTIEEEINNNEIINKDGIKEVDEQDNSNEKQDDKGTISDEGKNAEKTDNEEDENGNISDTKNETTPSNNVSSNGENIGTVNGTDVGNGNGNASQSGTTTTNRNSNNTSNTPPPSNTQSNSSNTTTNNSNSGNYSDYNNKVEVQNNSNLSYVEDSDHDYDYSEGIEDAVAQDNIAYTNYGQGTFNLSNNEKNKFPVTLNLVNAPYNNEEYCETQLNRSYTITLSSKPNNSTCSNYPTTLEFNDDGQLNIEKHRYTKTAELDFSNTTFTKLGDYYFDVTDNSTNEVVYQVIVSFRNAVDDEGYPLNKTVSIIQLKSMKTGSKVGNMNINLQNENTFITLEQLFEKDGINENFYLDVIIDSYNNELYSVLDGQDNSKIGNHIIANDGSSILNQTYRLTNGGKILIGQGNGKYQIPVGTKYKIVTTENKKYREKYEISDIGEYKVAVSDSNENVVTITNISKGNPNTGLYYTVIPFIILLVAAVSGLIIMKRLSIKK